MTDDPVIFWNKEPPNQPGYYWHSYTVDPSDMVIVQVEEFNGRLVVMNDTLGTGRDAGMVLVEDYGGRYSRWWPMMILPPPQMSRDNP